MAKRNETKDDYLEIKLKRSDFGRLVKINKLIERYIERKKALPPHLYQEFLNLFFPPTPELHLDNNTIHEKNITAALDYFKPLKVYHFSKKVEIKPEIIEDDFPDKSELTRIVSFENLIKSIVSDAFYESQSYEKRGFFVRKMYTKLDAYISQVPKVKANYTQHRFEVILGFLAYHFGYPLSPKLSDAKKKNKRPLTEDLSDFVRNDIAHRNVFKKGRK